MNLTTNFTAKMYRCLMLICLLVPTLAHAEKVLDKIEIVQTSKEAEIHIEFLTQVRYLRHAPVGEASRLQIFLEFPQLATVQAKREFLTSPPTDAIPGFTVNFPDQKTNSVGVRFKSPVKFTITSDNNGRGIVIHVPLEAASLVEPVVEAPATNEAVATTPTEIPAKPNDMSVNDYAGKLVAESRVAMGVFDYAKAIQLLNAALNYPAHAYSQEAQERIGIARKKNGELEKAKVEFEQYLKQYPEGDGAKRVRQFIADIDEAQTLRRAEVAKVKKPVREIHENTVYGSWDQFYFDAHTHNYNPNPATNKTTHDQSQLVSALNLTARFRQNEWDNKIVFRNTQTMNFLPKGEDRDRTQAAYVEFNNKEVDYLARLGRQNGNTGGILGRFDGALFRYGLTPQYKVNFVAGALNEYKVDYTRHFYGVNLDIGPINEKWTGNVYFINQETDRIRDRRAVGAEARYTLSNNGSIYGLLDYDTMFKKVNTAMVQANWEAMNGTQFNAQIDHRKSPILTMVNSLPAYFSIPGAGTTVGQVVRNLGLSESQIRQDALAQTLDTDLVLFGATRQFTPRWQLGADVQVTRSSGTQAAGQAAVDAAIKRAAESGVIIDPLSLSILQSSFGSGNTWQYHAQAVGTDTLFKNDTSVISATYTHGKTNQSYSLLLNNSMVPYEKWRLDSSIRLFRLQNDPSIVTYAITPTMHTSFQLREKASIEAEIGLEVSNTNDPLNGHTRTFRDFSYIGYRLDI